MQTLKAGDKVPNFTVNDQDGNPISLSDYQGKKLVVFFYPAASTPGCTAEACNLRDHYEDLKGQGFEVIGVSKDDEKSHQKFIAKYELPFELIADTEKKVVVDYGVWAEKKNYGKTYMGINRTTFIIDEDGVILKIFTKVKTKDHVAQILNELNN